MNTEAKQHSSLRYQKFLRIASIRFDKYEKTMKNKYLPVMIGVPLPLSLISAVRMLTKKVAFLSLIVLTITPVAVADPIFQFSTNTASSLKKFKQEGKPVKQDREYSKSHQLFTQSESVASEVEFLNGTWEGTYVCAQGLTNLKLVIEAKNPTEIDAVFLFSANPQNPNVPSGSFRMKGNLEVFNSPDIPDILYLKATTWINRPSGYRTIDLQGDISQSKRRITGNIFPFSCSTFDVIKRER